MTKAERRELIRQKLKAKGALKPLPKKPPKRAKQSAKGRGKWAVYDPFSLALVYRIPRWAEVPNASANLCPKISRAQRASPLTRIAAQLPKKLRRRRSVS